MRQIAYLPQQSELDRTFPARVVDLVSLGLWPKRGLVGRFTPQDRGVVSRALGRGGPRRFRQPRIGTLSAGQFQRVLFARVLVQDAGSSCSTSRSTPSTRTTVIDLVALVRRWHGESRTVIVAVHDLDLVRAHFPETLLLARRPVSWGPTAETLKPENLLKARRFEASLARRRTVVRDRRDRPCARPRKRPRP